MPTSNLQLAPRILHLIWQVRPTDQPLHLLDVGPGWGKYGVLVREYVDPHARVDAIEAEPRYVTSRLHAIYDLVMTGTAEGGLDEGLLDVYDVVLMVDVLEHLTRGDGQALLERIPGYVVICTPRYWFQNPEADDWPTEKHRSLWEPGDFGITGYGGEPRPGPLADRLDVYDGQAYADSGALLLRLKPTTQEG